MNEIDPERLPRHIAVIMDGNGRWAESHALGRVMGHRKGAESVRVVVKTCREIGIPYLTLYAFSTENWNRPQDEVNALLKLLGEYLENEAQQMMDQDIRLVAVGSLDALGETVREKLRATMVRTAGNGGMVLNLALSYGGRDELTVAARRMVIDALAGKLAPEEITQARLACISLYGGDARSGSAHQDGRRVTHQ